MQEQSEPPSRPRLLLEPFKPVSVFLCPCHVSSGKLDELVTQARAKATQADRGELLDLRLEAFEEECLGLHVNIQPRLFFLPSLEWVILALATELSPAQGDSITFEQLLAFNSNFRVCQGRLERQDTPIVGVEKLTFCLCDQRSAADVFEQVARQTLGAYEPPDALKRTVTLSIAQFERGLNDNELYAFGTIAHSDEMVDPTWAARAVQERAYDRWQPAGIRFFVHSYSLVCSCAPVENPENREQNWPVGIFVDDYLKMGVRLALERAELVELRAFRETRFLKWKVTVGFVE